MSTRISVYQAAKVFSAIEKALAITAHDGAAPNFALWKELVHASAIVKVYLLDCAEPIEVEVYEQKEAE